MFPVLVPLNRSVIGRPTRPLHLVGTAVRLTIGLTLGLLVAAALAVGGLVATARRLPSSGYR